jgi:hypothetical protein
MLAPFKEHRADVLLALSLRPSWRTLTCFPDLGIVDGFDWVFPRGRIAVDGVGADSGVGPVEAGPKTRSGEAGPE